MKTAEA